MKRKQNLYQVPFNINKITQLYKKHLQNLVLACMNITDELFLYKNQKKEVLSKIESKSNALLEFIDEKLS